MITFLLNQELREEKRLSPNMTVLNYLRTCVNRTGTKEGCGSGNCGTCTVVLAELTGDDQLLYRAVNACTVFVSALHGKQLITVEALKDQDGALHPVQQALVDCHGSQCGFCTPGIVMSVFSLIKNTSQPSRQQAIEALSGNLCRCTGYQPILNAALSLAQSQTIKDQFSEQEQSTIAKLTSLRHEPGYLSVESLSCDIPSTTDALAKLLEDKPQARLIAGSTDMAMEVTQQHNKIDALIDISHVSEMKTITEDDDRLIIGANVPLSDCRDRLKQYYPDFGDLLGRFASQQIRNQATLGGNIATASPIGDSLPLLIALNACLNLRQGSTTRHLPLEQTFTGYRQTALQPSEFIESISIPKPGDLIFHCYKVSKRLNDDISTVCAGFNIGIANGVVTSARIAYGGMAEIPKRAAHCEQHLLGSPWDKSTIEGAMLALDSDFTPLSDFRASARYRRQIAANLLYRFFIEQQNGQIDTRVTTYG
ncbi:xanthine dehydrogenase small subunit [Photobacterium gaetbulicola]|uniref:Putative xanthine dehydrogenase, XdhA subunit n=1 Tax=Photobacterium gaetbulicola Gung47 TaxID=658445 RepID=A0A0C5W4H6_9GAMM|nr:xanthine dehydrogenase small subunit [Photobacterium gaetbulicola]AJR06336.1 putative xanthine dehydrogenase, XdhA subunit [Photobacterium gaetbulicola Gung47]PSU08725.1 xanthine dehydrogenase small subunit [Photobacterium gaetbulicola]